MWIVKKFVMRLDKIVWILLVSLFLSNCAANRSNVGATLGATTTTGACVAVGIDNPYAIAACAVTGAFAGQRLCITQIMMFTMQHLLTI